MSYCKPQSRYLTRLNDQLQRARAEIAVYAASNPYWLMNKSNWKDYVIPEVEHDALHGQTTVRFIDKITKEPFDLNMVMFFQ